MALKIWLAIYPSITLFQYAFGGLLSGFPLPVKTFILTLTLVPWVVFIGVPTINFVQNRLFGNGK